MSKLRLVLVGVALAVVVGVPATVALGATKSVGVRKAGSRYLFSPAVVRIKAGDTVKWSWSGSVPHNVKGPGFTSKTANKLTFSRKFTKKGTFRVVCTIHAALGQRMVVNVS